MHLFRNIYSWFTWLYGVDLYNYLQGMDCSMTNTQPDQFWQIGAGMLMFTIILFLVYYFLWPRGRFNRLGSWLLVSVIVVIFGLLAGFLWSHSKEAQIPAYHLYGIENCTYLDGNFDSDGFVTADCSHYSPIDGATPKITFQNYIGFGCANATLWGLVFIFLSIVFKRFSKYCTHTPWKSLWPKNIYKTSKND